MKTLELETTIQKLSAKECKRINGGGVSEFTEMVIDYFARKWMRDTYDSAQQEANYMVYKM